jgi:hypothetical protein
MFRPILFVILIVLIIMPGLAFPQADTTGSVTGRILDAGDGLPLPGARVKIGGTNLGAVVNPLDGSFLIENIQPGEYTLIAHCLGYAELAAEVIPIKAGETTRLNFVLNPETVIMVMDIGPCGPPLFDKFETGKITHLSQRDIKKLPAKNIQDVLKVL